MPPPNYLEVLLGGGVTCFTAMMMYRGGTLQVLLESFTKDPEGFLYVFIFAGKVTILETIYCQTFVGHGIIVLGEDQ